MYDERLITGVAAVLGAIAVVFTIVALSGALIVFPVALFFAASALLMYDQLSGRMAARVYERVERRARVDGASVRGDGRQRQGSRFTGRRSGGSGGERGGFGAGPRDEWTPPRDGATAGEAAAGGRHRRGANRSSRGTSSRRRRTHDADGQQADGLSASEAYRTLGLEPGADESTVKAAYREKVKEVHPDTQGGTEAEFMAVKDAYERLNE